MSSEEENVRDRYMRGRNANTGEKIIIKADEKNYFDSMEL